MLKFELFRHLPPPLRTLNEPISSFSSSKSNRTPVPFVETPQPPLRQRETGTTP